MPGAWAGPEVDSVSKIVIEDLEEIDKSQNVCKPGTPKRGTKARSVLPSSDVRALSCRCSQLLCDTYAVGSCKAVDSQARFHRNWLRLWKC